MANTDQGNPSVRYQIDRSDPTMLHEQVANEIRRSIAEGDVAPGDRLPPAKDIAAVLGVNANTVFRALRALRDEGVLEVRRGRGVTVAKDASERGEVLIKARELVKLAHRSGYRRDELLRLIESIA